MSEFRAWLNEEWVNGKLTHHQHSVITEHSIINPNLRCENTGDTPIKRTWRELTLLKNG